MMALAQIGVAGQLRRAACDDWRDARSGRVHRLLGREHCRAASTGPRA
jgi:hypothetical protein